MWQFKYNKTIWIKTGLRGVTICLIRLTLAGFSPLCTPQNEFPPSGIEPKNEDFKCEETCLQKFNHCSMWWNRIGNFYVPSCTSLNIKKLYPL
jgi:hypothetical protein